MKQISTTFVGLAVVVCWCAVGAAAAHRLVAFGDVHGDIENAKAILRHAQVIDCDDHWNAGAITVVQTGDIVDRGNHPHELVDYFQQLKREAAAAGGEFIQLIGNHELMGLKGEEKFVMPAVIDAFGGVESWRESFSTTGRYGSVLAQLDTAVVRNRTLFVHAGLRPDFATTTVDEMNQQMRRVIAERQWNHALVMNDGPLWTRSLIYPAMKGECGLVHGALSRLSDVNVRKGLEPVTRMVVGHTIQPNGAIASYCNGTLIAIDIAISQYMQGGGHLGFVEFRHIPHLDKMVPIFFYPPVPFARHKLTRPARPSLGITQRARIVASAPLENLVLAALAIAILAWRVVNARASHTALGRKKKEDPAGGPVDATL